MTDYQTKFVEEQLKQTDSPTLNNSRSFWRKMFTRWYKTKNPRIGEDIAERFGLMFDYKSGYDYGNLPSEVTNNE